MADGKNIFIENLITLTSPEGIQKYVLGSKKNGSPRAIYDVVRDYTKPKKHKKHKKNKHKGKNKDNTSFALYVSSKKGKKKKKNKHWHI